MGDHRMSIKIDAEFHGVKKSCDMWINYYPDYEGIDQRVREFFQNIYAEGMQIFDKKMEQYQREEDERRERENYERLKAKFEPPEAVSHA